MSSTVKAPAELNLNLSTPLYLNFKSVPDWYITQPAPLPPPTSTLPVVTVPEELFVVESTYAFTDCCVGTFVALLVIVFIDVVVF